jgi:hypothetical protein
MILSYNASAVILLTIEQIAYIVHYENKKIYFRKNCPLYSTLNLAVDQFLSHNREHNLIKADKDLFDSQGQKSLNLIILILSTKN